MEKSNMCAYAKEKLLSQALYICIDIILFTLVSYFDDFTEPSLIELTLYRTRRPRMICI